MRDRILVIASVFLAIGAVFAGLVALARMHPRAEDPALVCAREVRAAELEVRRATGRYAERVLTSCGEVRVRVVGPAFYAAEVGDYRVFPDGIARVR